MSWLTLLRVWFLNKLNRDLPHDPGIKLQGLYPQEMETYTHTETCIQMFITGLIVTAKR